MKLVATIQAHPWMQRTLAVVGSPTVRIVLTLALVAFGLSQIPLSDVVDRLGDASVPLVAAGTALLLVGQAMSGQRWRHLAEHFGLHGSQRLFVTAYLRGCFYNSVLPTGIGGDAMRIAAVRPLGSWRSATRSVVVDRVTGLVALALAAGLLLPVAGLGLPPQLTWGGAGLALGGLIASLVWALRRDLLAWIVWTVAFEAVWFTGVWLLAMALSIQLGWATPAVVLVVGVAMALPISFGGHGAREAGFVLILAPLAIEADRAIALGVLFGAALAVVGLAGAAVRVPRPFADSPRQPTPIGGRA